MHGQSKWYLSYDVLRIIAILGVISIHLSAFFVLNYKPNTIEFFTENIFNGLSDYAVPIFLMITGALLLNEDKEFDDKKFIYKNWLPLVLLTIFWTVFYGLFYGYGLPALTHQPASFNAFLKYIISFRGSTYPHMWYMYMIIGMYLLIPILRLFVKRENQKYIFWLIMGCFIIQCIPQTLGFLTINAKFTLRDFVNQFYLYPFYKMIIYLFLGWYISNFKFAKNKRIIIYILGIICAFITVWSVQTYIGVIPSIKEYVCSDANIINTLYSIAVFLFIFTICKDKQNNHPKIKELSSFVFGIFIIHVLFIELLLQVIYPYSKLTLQIPGLYHIIMLITVFVLSYLTILIVSKIKYVKKIFYLK